MLAEFLPNFCTDEPLHVRAPFPILNVWVGFTKFLGILVMFIATARLMMFSSRIFEFVRFVNVLRAPRHSYSPMILRNVSFFVLSDLSCISSCEFPDSRVSLSHYPGVEN